MNVRTSALSQRWQLAFQSVGIAMVLAATLIQIQAIKNPPVLTLDETRDLPLLAELTTGQDAEYERCKSVLLNIGGMLAGAAPWQDLQRTEPYLAVWVQDSGLHQTLLGYRQKLGLWLPPEPIHVLMRTDPQRKIEIFRGARRGYIANLTFSYVRESDRAELFTASFEVQLVRATVSVNNPQGYALQTFKPLDHHDFWEK